MIADLSMYDWPGNQAQTDAFWAEVAANLRAAGIDAPARLTRGLAHSASWTDPDLLLGQPCRMPHVSGHCGDAIVVARPDYGLPEANAGRYRSLIVVRVDRAAKTGPQALLARAGCRVAVNEWRSYSGHVALRAHLAGLRSRLQPGSRAGATGPFFGAAVLSGGHRNSARMVARGQADMAALDGVVWALLKAQDPAISAMLQVIDVTAPAPALPFITARRFARQRADIVAALAAAAAALPLAAGQPCAVIPANDADFIATRKAARRAAAEPFAPEAPDIPAV